MNSLLSFLRGEDKTTSVAPLYQDEMQEAAKNLHADTTPKKNARKGDSKDPSVTIDSTSSDRIKKAMDNAKELKQKTKYGILRCDYEYIPTRGDPGEPTTLTYDGSPEPVIVKVEGWTFEAAQRGVSKTGAYPASEFRLTKADGTTDAYWTKLWEAYDKRTDYVKVTKKVKGDKYVQGYFDEEDYKTGLVYRYEPETVLKKMTEAVQYLDEQNVCGMTADVGFSQAFQPSVTKLTSTPVLLSSLQQLSIIGKLFHIDDETNKIVIMTANGKSFDEKLLIPSDVPLKSLVIVGLEDKLFGRWVAEGRSFSRLEVDAIDEASVEKALENVCDTCEEVMKQVEKDGGKVVCIVQECAELPAYTNGLRRRFDIPVYDTLTAINFVRMGRGFGGHSAFMM